MKIPVKCAKCTALGKKMLPKPRPSKHRKGTFQPHGPTILSHQICKKKVKKGQWHMPGFLFSDNNL